MVVILLFNFVQLPARQEPVMDSSKYTAADVRIVSQLFLVNPPHLFGKT